MAYESLEVQSMRTGRDFQNRPPQLHMARVRSTNRKEGFGRGLRLSGSGGQPDCLDSFPQYY